MGIARAQVTIPYTSGLPEDVVVNTFHFITGGGTVTVGEAADIVSLLQGFYNGAHAGAGLDLAGYLSPLLSRVANSSTVEVFDLADPEPRLPIQTAVFAIGPADTATTLPTETALCLSFQALPISGVPQARRRGRVFLGPFIPGQLDSNTGRPAATLITSIVAAGTNLRAQSNLDGVPWAVYSRVGNAAAAVASGWVDNEFDVMRSRGRRATTRSVF